MENVGWPLQLELVHLEIAAGKQRLAAVTEQQAHSVALLREPGGLPAALAVLELDFELASAPAELVHVADREHHPRDIGGDVHALVEQHPTGRPNRIYSRSAHGCDTAFALQGGRPLVTTLHCWIIGMAITIPASNTGSIGTDGLAIIITS